MAKKKFTGQINFFKAMTALGLVVIIIIVYGFFGAAPNMSRQPFHKKSDPMEECLDCHMINVKSAPIMPHRVMDACMMCHQPVEDE